MTPTPDEILAEMKRWAYSDAARTLEEQSSMPLTARELITHIEKWLAEQMGTGDAFMDACAILRRQGLAIREREEEGA